MPKLIVTKGSMRGKEFSFGGEVVFVGRSSENDIQLKVREVSRKHFKIIRKSGKLYIEDLISRNGTRINGEMIVPGKRSEVRETDSLSIANLRFRIGMFSGVKLVHEKGSMAHVPKSGSTAEKRSTDDRRTLERKNLELIWEVTELLRQSMSINKILEKVLRLIMNSLPRIDTSVIQLYDKEKGEFGEVFSMERFENVMEDVRFSNSAVAQVIREEKAIRMSNTKYESLEDASVSIPDLGIRSIMCVPLISNSKIFGAIYVDSRGVYGFRKDDLLLLNSLSGQVAVAVEKALLASKLENSPSEQDAEQDSEQDSDLDIKPVFEQDSDLDFDLDFNLDFDED